MQERRVPLPIENCRSWFKFFCPKTWGQLERTSQFDVRYCTTCRRNVFYCDSLEKLEEHRKAGHCICVEAGVEDEDYTMMLGEPWNEE
jgi:hypothetical protein